MPYACFLQPDTFQGTSQISYFRTKNRQSVVKYLEANAFFVK